MADPHKPNGGFAIAVTCPGCGGELTLQGNFFSLTCDHCGSVLRIIMPDSPPAFIIKNRRTNHEIRFAIDRYLKENGLPLARSGYPVRRLYAPYWKVEAIRVKVDRAQPSVAGDDSVAAAGEESGYLGLSMAFASAHSPANDTAPPRQVTVSPFAVTRSAAGESDVLPFSIGLRTEYVTMMPFSSEAWDDQARFLPVTTSWSEVCVGLSRTAVKKALLETGGCGRTEKWELFHPVGSLIYFPYLEAVLDCGGEQKYFLLDGLTGRVIHTGEASGKTEDRFSTDTVSPAGGQLTVVFHRCPNCGVDLPATRSVVYRCHNCDRIVSLESNRIFGGAVDTVAATDHASDRLLPFWVFAASPDAVRALVSLPAGVPVGDRLVVPAFTIDNFETIRRLCRRMTSALPRLQTGSSEENRCRPVPVTVSLSEAMTLAEIVLYAALVSARPGVDRKSISLRPDEAGLLYAPFHRDNYFLIDSALNAVTFEEKAVAGEILTETT